MTNGIGAADFAGRRSFVSMRLLRTGLALFFASSLTITSVAPAFAVTSSPAAPALAGLPAAPAPGLESSGEGAANVSPYDVNNGGAGLMSLMSGPEEQKSAKFEPPETPYGIKNPYTGRGAIEGLLPHGPHNVRDVLATHILKQTGSYEQASYAIQDTPDMVAQHYGRFLPQDKSALAAQILNQVWDVT